MPRARSSTTWKETYGYISRSHENSIGTRRVMNGAKCPSCACWTIRNEKPTLSGSERQQLGLTASTLKTSRCNRTRVVFLEPQVKSPCIYFCATIRVVWKGRYPPWTDCQRPFSLQQRGCQPQTIPRFPHQRGFYNARPSGALRTAIFGVWRYWIRALTLAHESCLYRLLHNVLLTFNNANKNHPKRARICFLRFCSCHPLRSTL